MAVIKQITDGTGNYIYPITKANATYMRGGIYTVEQVLEDMNDDETNIQFKDATIVKTVASGNVITTTFGDNRIIEVTADPEGNVLKSKTTVFNADGSIDITTEGE